MVHQVHEKVECSIASFGPRLMGGSTRATRGVDSTSAEPDKVKPCQPVEETHEVEESVPLDKDKVSGHGQLVARANYVAQDRADIQYAVKEVCRAMASPTRGHWRQVKRLGRCSEGRPRAIAKISCQQQPSPIYAFSDSDWAGCATSR